MLARIIAMPVQIWTDPHWYQFVGDTLPEMIFASAWTLLVTFFVQLVGIATGTGTNASPGIVIQATVSTPTHNKFRRSCLSCLFCFRFVFAFAWFCHRGQEAQSETCLPFIIKMNRLNRSCTQFASVKYYLIPIIMDISGFLCCGPIVAFVGAIHNIFVIIGQKTTTNLIYKCRRTLFIYF